MKEMEKEKYVTPEVEVVHFEQDDVITTSGNQTPFEST